MIYLPFGFVEWFLVIHRSLYGYGAIGVVFDCHGITARLTDSDSLINTSVGTAEAIEVAVWADIAELNAGITGGVCATVAKNLSCI